MIPGIIAGAKLIRLVSAPFLVDSMLTVSCSDVITLSARVFVEAGSATYLWEQISGTPVDWLENQDQTQVMFRQPSVRDDKVFRFWLNKGSSKEAFKDVLVSATPTDFLRTSNQAFVGSWSSSESNVFTYIEPIEIDLYPHITLPGYNETGLVNLNDPVKMVLFSNLKFGDDQLNTTTFTLQKVIGNGVYEDVLLVSSSERVFNVPLRFNIQEGTLYRLQKTLLGETTTLKNISYNRSGGALDLSIHDRLSSTQRINNGNLSLVTDVISRSVVTEDTSQDSVLTFSNTHYGSTSSVVDVITRSLFTQDSEVETLTTYSDTNNGSYSAVTEVRSYSYNSIG